MWLLWDLVLDFTLTEGGIVLFYMKILGLGGKIGHGKALHIVDGDLCANWDHLWDCVNDQHSLGLHIT